MYIATRRYRWIATVVLGVLLGLLSTEAQTLDPSSPPLFLTSQIEVRSEPPGAEVFIDGRAVGFTPVDVADQRPGQRRIRFEYRGYQEKELWITIPAGKTIRVEETLIPIRRTIELMAPAISAPLEIYLNGGWQKRNTLELAPGNYNVEVRAFGYQATTIPLFVPSLPDETDRNKSLEEGDSGARSPVLVGVELQQLETPTVTVSVDRTNRMNGFQIAHQNGAVGPIALDILSDGTDEVAVSVWLQGSSELLFSETIRLCRRVTPLLLGPFAVDAIDSVSSTLRVTITQISTSEEIYNDTFTVLTEHKTAPYPLGENGFGPALFPIPIAPWPARLAIVAGGGLFGPIAEDNETGVFVPAFLRFGAQPWKALLLTAAGQIRPGTEVATPRGDLFVSLGTSFSQLSFAGISTVVSMGMIDIFTDENSSEYKGSITATFGDGSLEYLFSTGGEIVSESLIPSNGTVRWPIGGGVRYASDRATIAGTTEVYPIGRSREDAILEEYAFDLLYSLSDAVYLQGAFSVWRERSGISLSGELGIGYAIDLR